MVHPVTGGSFTCPDRQVDTWRASGWLTEDEAAATKKPKTQPSTDPTPVAGDNTEE